MYNNQFNDNSQLFTNNTNVQPKKTSSAPTVIAVIILFIVIGLSGYNVYNNMNKNKDNNNNVVKEVSTGKFADGQKNDYLVPNDTSEDAMLHNTKYLQMLIDEASEKGQKEDRVVELKIPAGVYYFTIPDHLEPPVNAANDPRWTVKANVEAHNAEGSTFIIKLRDNVAIVGAGTGRTTKQIKLDADNSYYQSTEITGYTEQECKTKNDCTMFIPVGSNGESLTGKDYQYKKDYYGMSFFKYNFNYNLVSSTDDSSSKFEEIDIEAITENTKPDTRIKNVQLKNIIIDSKYTQGYYYTSSGKGVDLNGSINTVFDNVVIRNEDATCFGLDNSVNSVIKNSTAINCGKNAKQNNALNYKTYPLNKRTAEDSTYATGASAFGIGTGFANDESVSIDNCYAEGASKYGYFFENQGIFSKGYNATTSKGFKTTNSVARGNLINFGGNRSNDVTYSNNTSIEGTNTYKLKTRSHINFEYLNDTSRNSKVYNMLYKDANGNKIDNFFSDVQSTDYFYESANWAMKVGLTYGVKGDMFYPNDEATRAQAITFLWRYAGMPGNVITYNSTEIGTIYKNCISVRNNKEAYQNCYNANKYKATCGKKDGCRASRADRSSFPGLFSDVPASEWFASAVAWAKANNITLGVTSTTFGPNRPITRGEFVTFLYRYSGQPKVNDNDIKNCKFDDINPDDYYYDAVIWACSKGITDGTTETTFSPNAIVTRGQIVTFLYRYDNKIKG